VRNGSRLNKVLLPIEGVVAYSAVCTHTGCDVINWHPDSELLECPCHYSTYDPRQGAKIVSGPSPRRLPALPLKIVDGRLVVAKPFTGRAGFQQT
jgi:rieske iron-sulfur protein